jgi:hypothetical protein
MINKYKYAKINPVPCNCCCMHWVTWKTNQILHFPKATTSPLAETQWETKSIAMCKLESKRGPSLLDYLELKQVILILVNGRIVLEVF